jgi:hypothetical protein
VWVLSFVSFLVPFVEVGFFAVGQAELNQTLVETMVHTNQCYTELGLYYHLLAQIPIFFFTVVVMLVTYSKILQALNIRIGTRFQTSQKKKARRKKCPSTAATTAQHDGPDAAAAAPPSTGSRMPALGMRTFLRLTGGESSVGAAGYSRLLLFTRRLCSSFTTTSAMSLDSGLEEPPAPVLFGGDCGGVGSDWRSFIKL